MGLLFELPTPMTTKVRVVRCEPIDVALPGAAVWRQQDFALGVHFLDHNHELAAAIRSLAKQTGIEHSQARMLVLGKDDDVSRLVDKALSRCGLQAACVDASALRGEHREAHRRESRSSSISKSISSFRRAVCSTRFAPIRRPR